MSARFEAIGVVVDDLTRALAFYRELGLEFPEGEGHVESQLPGGLRFMLDTEETIRSFDPEWQPPSGGHRVAVAFRCDSPAGVDETYRRLLGAGGSSHKEPWDAFWGMRYAQVKDPAGNVVDLFAPL
ncbi:MAG TPA: VOC family protein [Gaiellaceae bacterium]|nr:VOC family protein [Gaiellaceae bacterium]